MKEVLNNALEHPFRTVIVVGAIAGGIARIIMSIKGVNPNPIATVNISQKPTETSQN